MIVARRVLWTLPILALPAIARAAPGAARFRVLREGREIGTHQVSLSGPAARRGVRTEIDLQVKLAGFTVFRLRHEIEEDWDQDRLRRLVSRHERNGKLTETQLVAEAGALVASGPEGVQRLPANAVPLTWWNPAIFTRPLFRPLNGKALAAQITRGTAPGGGVQYSLTGEVEATASYDAGEHWVALTTKGEDGSPVTYEPMG